MKYLLFGNTGLRVSPLCLGTMAFGTSWGFGAERNESLNIIKNYIEAGGNFIDTANVYTSGEAEEIVGEAINGIRDRIILSTKYSLCTNKNNPNSLGNHRKNLVTSVEDSLKRLNTDYIDLLWVHAWYFENRTEDVIRALDDMVRMGKVLYWGLSDTPAWICSEANSISNYRGYAPLSALQFEYSLIERTAEREIIPFADNYNIAKLGWAPLAGGVLTGKHHRVNPDKVDSLRKDRAANKRNEKVDQILDVLIDEANKHGISPSQLSLNWLVNTQKAFVPIIGARTVTQLKENMKSIDIKVDEETLRLLSTESKIDPGFPTNFLNSERTKNVMYASF